MESGHPKFRPELCKKLPPPRLGHVWGGRCNPRGWEHPWDGHRAPWCGPGAPMTSWVPQHSTAKTRGSPLVASLHHHDAGLSHVCPEPLAPPWPLLPVPPSPMNPWQLYPNYLFLCVRRRGMSNCGRAGPKTPSPPRGKSSWHQAGPAAVPLDPPGAVGSPSSSAHGSPGSCRDLCQPCVLDPEGAVGAGPARLGADRQTGGSCPSPVVPPSPPSTPYLHNLLRYLPRLVDVQDDFGVSHHRVESPSFTQAGRTGEGRR